MAEVDGVNLVGLVREGRRAIETLPGARTIREEMERTRKKVLKGQRKWQKFVQDLEVDVVNRYGAASNSLWKVRERLAEFAGFVHDKGLCGEVGILRCPTKPAVYSMFIFGRRTVGGFLAAMRGLAAAKSLFGQSDPAVLDAENWYDKIILSSLKRGVGDWKKAHERVFDVERAENVFLEAYVIGGEEGRRELLDRYEVYKQGMVYIEMWGV